MKLVVAQSDLSLALKQLKKTVCTRPSHADLTYVKVFLSGGVAFQTINIDAPCKFSTTATLNQAHVDNYSDNFYAEFHAFNNAVSCLEKNEAVVISFDGNGGLKVEGANSKASFSVQCKDGSTLWDGSTLFRQGDKKVLNVQSSSLFRLISSTAFAASRDAAKQILTGVHFDLAGNKLTAVATNGHIMPVMTVGNEVETDESEVEFTVFYKEAQEIAKLLKNKKVSPLTSLDIYKDYVDVSFSVGHVGFSYSLEMPVGTYPNYRQLFPDSFTKEASFNHKTLSQSLEGASKVAKGWNNVAKFTFAEAPSDDKVEISAVSGFESDENHTTYNNFIDTVNNCGDFVIAFNATYLIDGLKAISPLGKTNEVILHSNAPTTPAILVPAESVEGTEYKYLVMPVQVRRS
jgi:DNA polymerase-3 subunit beta